MINFNSNVTSLAANQLGALEKTQTENKTADFGKAVKTAGDYLNKVDSQQKLSDLSVQELLTGKNEDLTSVVSAVAKADMSFKVLVGVRNKLVDAYKQTMNMSI